MMNERMIELYKEASEFAYKICREEGRAGGPSDHIWNTLSTGKFAELIVRECAELSVNSQYANTKSEHYEGFNEALIYAGNKIKEHFGVEE